MSGTHRIPSTVLVIIYCPRRHQMFREWVSERDLDSRVRVLRAKGYDVGHTPAAKGRTA
jgi:hypothetical protein